MLGKYLSENLYRLLHLLSASHGDTAVGLFERGKVSTHQDLVLKTGGAKFTGRTTQVHEDVIRVRVCHLEAHVPECTHYEGPNLRVLLSLPVDMVLILKRRNRRDRA